MENQNHAFNYAYLLKQVKARVLLAQKEAIYTANEEMLSMYWDIGKLLSESQKQIGWGKQCPGEARQWLEEWLSGDERILCQELPVHDTVL